MALSSAAGAANPENEPNHAEHLIKQVHADIAVDDKILSEARRRRNLVTGTAVQFPGALRGYASGSVAAGLAIHKVEDADGGVVLDRRSYPELGPDGQGVGPRAIVEAVAKFVIAGVRQHYPSAQVEIGRRSIKITFNEPHRGEYPYVDLIVGLTRKEPQQGLWIPQLEDGIWDASDPEKHTELFTRPALPKELRVYRARIVRIGKACLKQDDQPAIASFHFGSLTLMHIDQPVPETLVEGLQQVFAAGADELQQQDTPDPAGVSDPIKLNQPRSRVVARLDGIARTLQEAIDHSSDEAAARAALAKVFPEYIDPPKGSQTHAIASELRAAAPGAAVSSAFGDRVAGSKQPRSFGDAPSE